MEGALIWSQINDGMNQSSPSTWGKLKGQEGEH